MYSYYLLILPCRRDSSIAIESINFRQFVRTLARFKRESKGHEHEMNTMEKKLDCEWGYMHVHVHAHVYTSHIAGFYIAKVCDHFD